MEGIIKSVRVTPAAIDLTEGEEFVAARVYVEFDAAALAHLFEINDIDISSVQTTHVSEITDPVTGLPSVTEVSLAEAVENNTDLAAYADVSVDDPDTSVVLGTVGE